jgi:gamma-glutamylcyclotransferase (GGCT)/AIG2-like uncharacterized protein YtfP
MTVLARTPFRPSATSPSRPAYAGLIPETAAGRDAVFFFGTLMHAEVLARVLDRPVAANETAPAALTGFRRERALEASYPVLVDDPAAAVDGRLLHRPSRRDILRINHFEDEEYRAHRVTVIVGADRHPAWVFLALDDVAMMSPSGEPWHLEHWAAVHLDDYRVAIDGWMADAPR